LLDDEFRNFNDGAYRVDFGVQVIHVLGFLVQKLLLLLLIEIFLAVRKHHDDLLHIVAAPSLHYVGDFVRLICEPALLVAL